MKPHFDKCIDDFAKRLSEFVSNAGNTLYKGISEILERTMTERRAHIGSLAEFKATTAQQIQQIRAAGNGLRQLRESLWAPEPAAAALPTTDIPPDVS